MKTKFVVEVVVSIQGKDPLKKEIRRVVEGVLYGKSVNSEALIDKVTVRSVDKD